MTVKNGGGVEGEQTGVWKGPRLVDGVVLLSIVTISSCHDCYCSDFHRVNSTVFSFLIILPIIRSHNNVWVHLITKCCTFSYFNIVFHIDRNFFITSDLLSPFIFYFVFSTAVFNSFIYYVFIYHLICISTT